MKQEPVACLTCDGTGFDSELLYGEKQICPQCHGKPLYTAPKELSVKEIQEVFDNCWVEATRVSIVDFVRAILKKASER